MKHPYHFGSPNRVALREVEQIGALIRDLDRIVRILESDIATEEERSSASDRFDAAYPIIAKMMTARRDNLKETIVSLERRLSSQRSKVDRSA